MQEKTVKRGAREDGLLRVSAEPVFVPVVSSFAGEMAAALGLGKSEVFAFTLAAEEVFSHLCGVVPPGAGWIEISCSGSRYYVRLDFLFSAADLNMHAFNITANLSLGEDSDLEQMGLLLASRSVDRFHVESETGRRLRLSLTKDKAYPVLKAASRPPVPEVRSFSVRPPEPGELKAFAELVQLYYRDGVIPEVFNTPGMLVDMVGGGEFRAALAFGPQETIAGGTYWNDTGTGAVELFGPYVFNQAGDSGIAEGLLDECIGAIARGPASVLINRYPTPEFPRDDFEFLGSVLHHGEDGTASPRDAWARLLHEDLGCVVWTHPELDGFLRGEYERLFLPREVRLTAGQGEAGPPHSVLLSTFDRSQGSVTLRPIMPGDDFETVLTEHLLLFDREGIRDVFFAMDLGRAWEAELAPHVLEKGFSPRMVLPYTGAADVVTFQLERRFG
ncbi:MAG: hypothetical protein LLG06_13625 [Desulfobacteraceae bacterium]|nr:hypothetical protein [Desulfobacteraceae bacterium]